jgi:hypothetical protein
MKHNNVNRYAEFCQFRREIRGSAEHVIVVIDVAKERHHAFFGTATGQALLKRLLFDNNAGGFGLLLERGGQLKTRHISDRPHLYIVPSCRQDTLRVLCSRP